MNRISRAATVAVASVVFASAAHAGWVLKGSSEQSIISKGKMKSSWQTGAMILDGNANKIYFIDDGRKMMASGTVEDLCTGMEQMIESTMKSMMKDVPAEQREMMQKMMGGGEPPEVELVKKGDGGDVAGFKTVHYQVMANGELHEDLWLSNDKALMGDCQPLMKMIGEFTRCMSTMSSMGSGPGPEASPEYARLFELGMMVKSVDHGDDDETMMIAPRDVADSEFTLPEGYQSVPFSKLFGGMGGQ